MNNRDKLVEVMSEYRLAETKLDAARRHLEEQEKKVHEVASRVVRTFHAVLGDRSEQGVVYRKERWRVVHGGIERTSFDLEVLE